jgi:hypothetical protein
MKRCCFSVVMVSIFGWRFPLLQEKDKIMRQVTGATQNLERERTRQALITQQKKEKKKAKAVETVSQMVREVSAVEMK